MSTDSVDDAEYIWAMTKTNQEISRLDLDNPKVWVDRKGNVSKWSELNFEHLEFIIMGLRSGRSYSGQGFKIKQAEKELQRRLSY